MSDESVWRRHFGERAPVPERRLSRALQRWRIRRDEVLKEHDRPRDRRFALRRMPLWVRVALWWDDRSRSKAAMQRRVESLLARLNDKSAADAKEYSLGYERGYASGRQDERTESRAARAAAKARGA